ncbi:MAG: helix-turn-helix domain-containing protein [Sphingomonas sp.]|uniref:helix-turn-helix domain-containing protein n=1 Tax=Sphingomonas sp. TaxID=28214 RepID=UPI0025D62B7A|nr:helix-turn-helix domain-containing protein [Sphingomonas sp.]MBQ1500356.1 helix-turn-helix domain-containing protein [Sphingomonas sp.]MBQ8104246.1 helix-turn-helix domain-containing protein [Afipia sp.]
MNRISYNINEVASMLGLGRTTIYKLIDEGKLARVKVGARTLILARDVDALLQRQAA